MRGVSGGWNMEKCGGWTWTRSCPSASRPPPCACSTCSCCTACCPTARPTRPRKSPNSSTTSNWPPSAAASPACACNATATPPPSPTRAPRPPALDPSPGSDDRGAARPPARALMRAPASTPSARVLDAIERRHGCNFEDFARRQSIAARDLLLALPWSAGQQARYLALADESVAAQKAIEAADTLPFEAWREQYMAVAGLG